MDDIHKRQNEVFVKELELENDTYTQKVIEAEKRIELDRREIKLAQERIFLNCLQMDKAIERSKKQSML